MLYDHNTVLTLLLDCVALEFFLNDDPLDVLEIIEGLDGLLVVALNLRLARTLFDFHNHKASEATDVIWA